MAICVEKTPDPAVGAVGIPVSPGEFIVAYIADAEDMSSFVANEFVIVVAKFSSSLSAAANSFSVSRAPGAPLIRFVIDVSA